MSTESSRAAALFLAICVVAFCALLDAAPILWQVNGHYYQRVDAGGITWTDAKLAAESSTFLGTNGHLATVNSEAEWLFILDNFAVSYTWIGLSDAVQEGNFEWVTGELTSPQEPNNAATGVGEDYVYYESRSGQPPGHEYGWNDYPDRVNVIGALALATSWNTGFPNPRPGCSRPSGFHACSSIVGG